MPQASKGMRALQGCSGRPVTSLLVTVLLRSRNRNLRPLCSKTPMAPTSPRNRPNRVHTVDLPLLNPLLTNGRIHVIILPDKSKRTLGDNPSNDNPFPPRHPGGVTPFVPSRGGLLTPRAIQNHRAHRHHTDVASPFPSLLLAILSILFILSVISIPALRPSAFSAVCPFAGPPGAKKQLATSRHQRQNAPDASSHSARLASATTNPETQK